MKKTLVLLLALVGMVGLKAEAQDWAPMLNGVDTKTWNCVIEGNDYPKDFTKLINASSSTEVDGVKYYSTGRSEGAELFREEDGRLYYKESLEKDEFVVFDFNLKVGDVFDNSMGNKLEVVATGDTTVNVYSYDSKNVLDVTKRSLRYLKLRDTQNNGIEDVWVESVGSLTFGIFPEPLKENNTKVLTACFVNGNELMFFDRNEGGLRTVLNVNDRGNSNGSQQLTYTLKDGKLNISGYMHLWSWATHNALYCQVKGNDIFISKTEYARLTHSGHDCYYVNVTIPGLELDEYTVHVEGISKDYETETALVKADEGNGADNDNGLFYTLWADGTASVSVHNYARNTLTRAVIPEYVELEGKTVPVTKIDGFASCKSLQTVSIPKTVVELSSLAFYNCESLKEVVLPNSVRTIGMQAFMGCTSLENIVIPESVETISDGAFMGCVTDIEVSNGNKRFSVVGGMLIGKMQYNDNDVVTIGPDWGVVYCPTDKKGDVVVADSITHIVDYAFNGCKDIETVKIGGKLEYIGNYAFAGCEKATFVVDETNEKFNVYDDALYNGNMLVACGKVEDGELCLKEGIVGISSGAIDGVEMERLVFPTEIAFNEEDTPYYMWSKSLSPANLKEVVVKSIRPPYGPEFGKSVYSDAKLVVPELLKDVYAEIATWQGFKNVNVVATDYTLYPKTFVLSRHEDTKAHYVEGYATDKTPRTQVLRDLAGRYPQYLAGDETIVMRALNKAWFEYGGKADDGGVSEEIVCKDGSIWLLDDIDHNGFMNYLLKRDFTKGTDADDVAEYLDESGKSIFTKNCNWEIMEGGEPESKFLKVIPSSNAANPSVGIDFSDLAILANYPYEITIVTAPDVFKEDMGKPSKLQVEWFGLREDYMNHDRYKFNAYDGGRTFELSGEKYDTLKLDMESVTVANGVVLVVNSAVTSRQLETYTRTIRICSVAIAPKDVVTIDPTGIEGVSEEITDRRTDNAIYDLMGRRLNGVPVKGIYIQNGKKYVR